MRAEVEAILALIRERSGVDFQHHRPHFVERRLRQRMASAGVHHAGDYLALIAEDPAEVFRAVERLTIKVSRFFRDARAAEVACAAARGAAPGSPRAPGLERRLRPGRGGVHARAPARGGHDRAGDPRHRRRPARALVGCGGKVPRERAR